MIEPLSNVHDLGFKLKNFGDQIIIVMIKNNDIYTIVVKLIIMILLKLLQKIWSSFFTYE